jgi:hypothetical protein
LTGLAQEAIERRRIAARAALGKVSARLAEIGTGRLSLSQEGADGRLSAPDGSDGGLGLVRRELDGDPKA